MYWVSGRWTCGVFFFFNDTAPTEIYTLSLHDALPISPRWNSRTTTAGCIEHTRSSSRRDRKSTRLNSSHTIISYAVFCLKKTRLQEERVANREDDGVDADLEGEHANRDGREARSSVFFNDTAATEIYTLSLHDALPI